jgi:putative ABC transport system permease protein
MFLVSIKSVLGNFRRLVGSSIAVLLGVSFLAGTFILSDSLKSSFSSLFDKVNKNTDAYVEGKAAFKRNANSPTDERPRVDVSVLETIRNVDGVKSADGLIQAYGVALVNTKNKVVGVGPAPNFGFSWVASDLNPYRLTGGRGPQADNEIVIDQALLDKSDYRLGDKAKVVSAAATDTFTIVGVVRFGTEKSALGSTAIFFTASRAQALAGAPGQFDQLYIDALPGVSQEQLTANITKAVDTDMVVVKTGKQVTADNKADIDKAFGFLNIFFTVFAVIALFVSTFVIYNAFSIVVAQRTRELALLRAIGATGRQVKRAVKIEAAATGLFGALVGILGGVAIAIGIQAVFSAIGLTLPGGSPVVRPRTIVLALVVGVGVSLLSAWFPARRAARIPPLAALRDLALDTSATSKSRLTTGLVVAAASIALLVYGLGPGTGSAAGVAVGASTMLAIVAMAVLGPLVALPASAVIGAPLPALRGISGVLARQNAMRNPKRTASTAMALVIGVAIVTFILVLSQSLKARLRETVDKQLTADFIINTTGFGFGFSPEVANVIAATPGTADVTPVRFRIIETRIDGGSEAISAAPPATIGKVVDLGRTTGDLAGMAVTGIAVSDGAAKDHEWKLGDSIEVTFPSGGTNLLTLAATYENADVLGPFLISRDLAIANTINNFDSNVYVNAAPGSGASELRARLDAAVANYPTADVQNAKEFTDAILKPFNMLLGIVYGLLFLSIVIAVFGIANTASLSIHERTRELGLLRGVGMTRSQLRTSIRWESVIVSLFGTLGGLMIGLVFGIATVTALDKDAVKLTIPVGALVIIAILAALAGVVAAVRPARKASKLNVLDAIAAS